MSKYKTTFVLQGKLIQNLHFGPYARNYSSEAITSIYQQAFSTKTRLDGLLVIGYDDSEICEKLLSDIYFHPYTFTNGSINLTIFGIEFNNKEAIVRIYQNFQEIQIFHNTNPNSVWNKIGLLAQFTGSMLFGLEYERTKSEISKELTLSCTVENWQNEQIMNTLFNYHLRKNINISIKWKKFFISWQNQESNLIELTTKLQEIYPPNYTIKDCELRAWRTLLHYTGCTNITPSRKESTDFKSAVKISTMKTSVKSYE
ncbi:1885_t:CDS:2 [Scutellospora calospora]|uniref:1885_t:CDS:1 n=1 Tax=Scutellospora calospora TaxID=85575 RepID=A0ACA9KC59_9GLOM|nr:1885_t:CDS:2 [Scutellospora calospora]